MPLYEYQCQQCQRRVEKIQKFADAPLTTCPHCAGTLERTITAPAIQFKGSGWYKDLYSSAKPPAATGSGGEAAPAAGGSSEGSTAASGDAKPASAPAPATPSAPAAAGSSSSSSSGTSSSSASSSAQGTSGS